MYPEESDDGLVLVGSLKAERPAEFAARQSGLSPGAFVPRMSTESFCGRRRVLPLWRARASRVEDGPSVGAIVVFSGTLRSPGEPDALGVNLSLQAGEIAMQAEDEELGRWPATAVEIRRFGKTAFEFTAEGDRLIFTPDDPVAFGDSPIVVGEEVDTSGREGRKARKRAKRTEPKPTRDRDSINEQRSGEREEKPEKEKRRARKRPRRHRRTPAELAGGESATGDGAPAAKPDVAGASDTTSDGVQREGGAPSETGTPPSDGRRSGELPEADDGPSTALKGRIHAAWIRTLDIARRYDTFGLDRVPIDTSLRGQEHQHTWDHRVAATSGLGQHICTICGAIRR